MKIKRINNLFRSGSYTWHVTFCVVPRCRESQGVVRRLRSKGGRFGLTIPFCEACKMLKLMLFHQTCKYFLRFYVPTLWGCNY